jgi:hypothetical protein
MRDSYAPEQLNASPSLGSCPEVNQADLFLATPRDPERFSYPLEIDPGIESEQSSEIEFLTLIKRGYYDGRSEIRRKRKRCLR